MLSIRPQFPKRGFGDQAWTQYSRCGRIKDLYISTITSLDLQIIFLLIQAIILLAFERQGLKPHIDIVWQRSMLHRFKINCYLCETTVSRINGQGAQLVSIEIHFRLLIKLLITLDLSVSVWLMSVSTCTVQLAVGLIPI